MEKYLNEIENLREENRKLREIIKKWEEISKLDDEAYNELELSYEELRLEYCALCEETKGFKIDYEDEHNFHINYGDITPAIARHMLNSKTLKEIANKER